MPLKGLHGQLLERLAFFVGADIHHALACGKRPFDRAEHLLPGGVAYHHIGLGHRGRLGRKGLRVTAGKHGYRARGLALGAPQPLAAFFIAPGGYGAAVHHIHIRCLTGPCQGITAAAEQLFQGAGLVLVYLAPQGIKTYAHYFSPCSRRLPALFLPYYKG